MQLQNAFPGVDGDLAIMQKWIEYLTNTKGMERHAWQFIKFADAASIIPHTTTEAVTKDGAKAEPEADTPAIKSDSVESNAKKAKPEKVSGIDADKLVQYLQAARLRLAWNEKGKPSGQQLEWWLEEIEYEDGKSAWGKLRGTDRRTASKYGYNVDRTKQWVKALENEIKRRQEAGILVPGAEDWD